MPPERAQAVNEHSPVIMSKRLAGSPEIFESTSLDSSDSPLLSSQLCSHSEEDDGFIDLDYLEVHVISIYSNCRLPAGTCQDLSVIYVYSSLYHMYLSNHLFLLDMPLTVSICHACHCQFSTCQHMSCLSLSISTCQYMSCLSLSVSTC